MPKPKTARVYLGKSRVAHIVPVGSDGNPAPDARCVRCGVRPRPWLTWSGTGGRFPAMHRAREKATALKLPLCTKTLQEK